MRSAPPALPYIDQQEISPTTPSILPAFCVPDVARDPFLTQASPLLRRTSFFFFPVRNGTTKITPTRILKTYEWLLPTTWFTIHCWCGLYSQPMRNGITRTCPRLHPTMLLGKRRWPRGLTTERCGFSASNIHWGTHELEPVHKYLALSDHSDFSRFFFCPGE